MLINDLVDSLKNVLENFCDIADDQKVSKGFADDELALVTRGRTIVFRLKGEKLKKPEKSTEESLAEETDVMNYKPLNPDTFIMQGKVEVTSNNDDLPMEFITIKTDKGTMDIYYPGITQFTNEDKVEILIRKVK